MEERQRRIGLLTRANRGRLAVVDFLPALSAAIGQEVGADRLLSLPESDKFSEAHHAGYRQAVENGENSYRRFFRREEAQSVDQLANCLAEHFTEEVFLLTKQSEDCGAVIVDLATLLRHAKRVIRPDGDSLMAISKDRVDGLLLDFNPDDPEQTSRLPCGGRGGLLLHSNARQSEVARFYELSKAPLHEASLLES